MDHWTREKKHGGRLMAWLGSLAGVAMGLARAAVPDSAGGDFFENRVRPLLVEHCYECHSAGTPVLKGGLRLDTAEGVRAGGAGGPVIVAGNPAESRLIQAVRGHLSDLGIMPPKTARGGSLRPEQIADLEEWVSTGAKDPRVASATNNPIRPASAHWAFRPPVEPPVPSVRNVGWIQRPLDRWVLAHLEARGLTPSQPADPRTLLRRMTLDVTGLPPTPEEMDAFLADRRSDAYERAVDRLLGSPRYGERWARIWLDVARYADTKGYVFEEERRYPYSYTYRDWVVQALNDDLPYDRFLQYQIAGDLFATAEDPSPMAALGFLTLGRRFLNNESDIIDDRIDVVFRGTQALTVQCARCHDHKFDPIPTADYYSLYGIFQSSREPGEKPLLGPSRNLPLAAEFEVERAKRVQERDTFHADSTAAVGRRLRERVGDYLMAAHESLDLEADKLESLARTRSLDPRLVGACKGRLGKWRTEGNPLFAPWFALMALPENELETQAIGRLKSLMATNSLANPALFTALIARPYTNYASVGARFGEAIGGAVLAWTHALEMAKQAGQAPPKELSDSGLEQLRQVVLAPDSPIEEALNDVNRFFDTPTAQKSRALQRRIEELEATHPGAPRRAMALVEKEKPVDPVIFKRGNPGNRGDQVPRQFLGMIAGKNRKPFTQGSGRRELAEAITHPQNPLTARVMVNRIWLRHLGTPLVSTPSDFGVRSDPPTHPELLDHLAVFFRDHGWSMKTLHREILLSATYRQATAPANPVEEEAFARNEALDPMNQNYWRQNRRRLEFEALRDALLSVSGHNDPTLGGQPVEIHGVERPVARRTLYGFIDRQNLPAVLRAFDFASPDSTSSARFQTTVPQQALYFLNSEAGVELARQVAARPEVQSADSDAGRIRQLYRLLFQRLPTAEEEGLGLGYLAAAMARAPGPPEPEPSATWSYGWGHVHAEAGSPVEFQPFKVYREESWRPGNKFPMEDALGHAQLTKGGGHPGRDAQHGVIRRWTAPTGGVVRIVGRLGHEASQGDGVRAGLFSSRGAAVQRWSVQNAKVETVVNEWSVKAGETLDFLVEPGESDNSDTFRWNVTISLKDDPQGRMWRSEADFGGPKPDRQHFSVWERYCQALLAANEFVFLD